MSTLGLFWAVIAQFSKQQLQISQVLSAIANGDTSLGLPSRHPLHAKFINVTSQLKHSQIEAQTQAHYLQTLLIHLDIAIIVVSESGDISQKNPASERLLGSLPGNVAQLSHLGECIHRAIKDEKLVISWQKGEHQDRLSVQITCVSIDGKALKLVSIQSIYLALQAKEQQAYKKLTKVLTHEIANSITPLTSLSQTAVTLVPSSLCFDDEEDKQDLQLALDTIANRTQHLDEFIARFRSLSQLPPPNLHVISLSKLVSRTLNLFEHQWQQQRIEVQFDHHSDYQLMADAAQIEQVLINLLKNATEAISQQAEKRIQLRLHQNEQAQVSLDIIDSGAGIAEHVLEMIFVPFFTTKPQGSGIGLSLSRHIMIQHGGDLAYINSKQGACFRLTFS
ncbi:GHKL domain-containing protein [Shewanella sp. KX20019]|uniref:sensor histidine kinase n=1 Tax=Shewanella sp. KX20019 TaxID=2803864 RepID=UPI001925EBCD|nr:ATP-binding protein [Shewanella sp. KX20019]QQX80486.1 GHKL domain-containing protein [Shewanella sp. KX20019]